MTWLSGLRKSRSKNRTRTSKARSRAVPASPRWNINWRPLLPVVATCVAIAGVVVALGLILNRPVRRIEVVGPFQHVAAAEAGIEHARIVPDGGVEKAAAFGFASPRCRVVSSHGLHIHLLKLLTHRLEGGLIQAH